MTIQGVYAINNCASCTIETVDRIKCLKFTLDSADNLTNIPRFIQCVSKIKDFI